MTFASRSLKALACVKKSFVPYVLTKLRLEPRGGSVRGFGSARYPGFNQHLHRVFDTNKIRGRVKEERFVKKVTEMLLEEEKKRIPIAQGVPFTIDEPECLIKPPVKECTEPLDIVLHSDVRAIERAGFDQYVMERLELAKQFKLERERRQKMEEEEEIRRLRRELVPRAQPMPYFDRPFIPKKSEKPRTIPMEPKFHVRPVEESLSASGC